MKVSLIREDSVVYVDRVAKKVDCSKIDEAIHAIQWDSDRGVGEIEFVPDADGHRKMNEKIDDFSQFSFLIDSWNVKNAEDIAEKAASDAKIAEQDARRAAQLAGTIN